VKKRTGYVTLQRPKLAEVFRRIEAHKPPRGPIRNTANARLLIFTAMVHCDYLDVAAAGKERGQWDTTYREICELTGLKRSETQQALMFLNLLGVMDGGPGNPGNKPQTPEGKTLKPRNAPLSLRCLFYQAVTAKPKENPGNEKTVTPAVTSKELQSLESLNKGIEKQHKKQSRYLGTSENGGGSVLSSPEIPSETGSQKRTYPPRERKTPGLIQRQALTIREAREQARSDLRPTLTLIEKLGVATISPTRFRALVSRHNMDLRKASPDNALIGRTPLYDFLKNLVDDGKQFRTLNEIMAGAEQGA
jgi:hypothetical protein